MGATIGKNPHLNELRIIIFNCFSGVEDMTVPIRLNYFMLFSIVPKWLKQSTHSDLG
jgi:hypothetical protein